LIDLKSALRKAAPPALILGGVIGVAALVIAMVSDEPLASLWALVSGPARNHFLLGEALNGAAFLLLAGLGSLASLRSGGFNLGGEGQAYLGGVTAALACLGMPSLPGAIGLPLALAAGAASGALVAGASGALKRLGADELITSFLASSALVHILDYAMGGPLRDTSGSLIALPPLEAGFALPKFEGRPSVSLALPVALGLALVGWILLERTRPGFRFRAAGANAEFARYAGLRPEGSMLAGMFVSGALIGLAGAALALSSKGLVVSKGFHAGLGWNGLAVALIARGSPLAAIPCALAFSWLRVGATAAAIAGDFGGDLDALVQAAVFFLATARLVLGRARRPAS
jgi:simple sugar transport system permease protein